MSAGSRIYPDTFYVNGAPIPAAFFIAVDAAGEHALDADAGGVWAPLTPIVIAGAGVWVVGPWTFTGAAAAQTVNGSGKRLIHTDGDYVTFESGHPAQTRNLTCTLARAADASYTWSTTAGIARFFYENVKDGQKSTTANTVYGGGGRLVMDLRVHHGSTLAFVQFYFAITQSRSALPQSLPMFRVFYVDAAGNVTNCCTNTAIAGWAGNGFIQMATPSGGTPWVTYYNSGNPQYVTFTCDAGIVVDTTKYCYYVEVIDESGTNALSGNEFMAVQAVCLDIPNLQPD